MTNTLNSSQQADSSVHNRPASETTGNRRIPADRDLWLRFAQAATSKEFCESWLTLQCQMLEKVRCGLILLGPPDQGPFTPAGVWPDSGVNVTHLANPAERALKERRGLCVKADREGKSASAGGNAYYIAYPIEISDKLYGAVILEVDFTSDAELQSTMRLLHWGVAWLEVMIRRQESAFVRQSEKRLQQLLDGVATVVEHEKFQQGAMAFVTKLATDLDCERVSLGLIKGNQIKVHALSHSAGFGQKMNLVRAIGSAMDEAVDQKSVILYPLPKDAPAIATIAHEELVSQSGTRFICTIPFVQGEKGIGAMMFERSPDKPFDDQTMELLKTFGAIVGPLFSIKKKDERLIWLKIWESIVFETKRLMSPERPGFKLAGAVALIIIVFFMFAKGDHRVSAPTVLEGVVQRAVTAPFNGYVFEAPARPGDEVREGQMLCRLDERDLKLERLKWSTQYEQFMKQYADAMAKHERTEVVIAQSKADEADAEIRLLDEQLIRSKIIAPFDGIVTSGDLSQSIGSPVERGQVLYEVAPLHGYRVIVQVDERDIGYVAIGQKGELALPSLTGQVLPLTVTKVTPVSTAKDGRNFFRVEAQLGDSSTRLRPGMEGVGKITVERRRLIWIWTHEIVEWIRLKLWSWLP